jgi:hypothetical protein
VAWVLLTSNINRLPAQEAFLVDAPTHTRSSNGGFRLRSQGGALKPWSLDDNRSQDPHEEIHTAIMLPLLAMCCKDVATPVPATRREAAGGSFDDVVGNNAKQRKGQHACRL